MVCPTHNHAPLISKLSWDNIYSTDYLSIPSEPSSFARLSVTHMRPLSSILEIGCGTGRDSEYFASLGYRVAAIDGSAEVIKRNKQRTSSLVSYRVMTAEELCDDDDDVKDQDDQVDNIYMRFFIHSISETCCESLLQRCFNTHLRPGGRLFVECRSINDPMFGVGTKVGRNEFINGHYRRFIVKDELVVMMRNAGFKIAMCNESDCLSVVGNDNPALIRIIGEK